MVDMRVYQDIQNASQPNVSLLNHIGLVKRVALHLKARLPNFMELEELIQVGMIGLIEADKSFDASKGVDFEIFAKNRIRGAILDQVRKMSYLPRSAIVNIREHNEATAELTGMLGRAPTQSELAEHMGKDAETFQKERTHAHRFQTVSFEDQTSDSVDLPSDHDNEPERYTQFRRQGDTRRNVRSPEATSKILPHLGGSKIRVPETCGCGRSNAPNGQHDGAANREGEQGRPVGIRPHDPCEGIRHGDLHGHQSAGHDGQARHHAA